MKRFGLRPRQKPTNGWKPQQLRIAKDIAGPDFDPNAITPEEFIDQRMKHYLDAIHAPYKRT